MVNLVFIVLVATLACNTFAAFVGNKPIIPFKKGPCLPPDIAMKNFQPEKFFNGKWFERSSYENDLTEADGKCSGMSMKISGNDAKILFYHYEDFAFNTYTTLNGNVEVDKIQDGNFHINVQYPDFVQSLPVSMVATDYDNYAVLYICYPFGMWSDEMVWVLTRERANANYDFPVNQAVKSLGLDPKKFTYYGPQKCPLGEPSL